MSKYRLRVYLVLSGFSLYFRPLVKKTRALKIIEARGLSFYFSFLFCFVLFCFVLFCSVLFFSSSLLSSFLLLLSYPLHLYLSLFLPFSLFFSFPFILYLSLFFYFLSLFLSHFFFSSAFTLKSSPEASIFNSFTI